MTLLRGRPNPSAIRDRVRVLAGRNRWLFGVLALSLAATALADPTIGAAGSGATLLGGSEVASTSPGPIPPARPPAASSGTPAGAPAGAALTTPSLTPRPSTTATPPPGVDGGDASAAPEGPPLPPPMPPGPSEPTTPCPAGPPIAALDDAQQQVESTSGSPLPLQVSDLVVAALGCQGGGEDDPGSGGSPLDALSVIGQLLDTLGIAEVHLPPPPEVPVPPAPRGFDTLGPVVLPVCAETIQQLVTVAALAPVARLDTREVVALFDPLIAVCALFAPKL